MNGFLIAGVIAAWAILALLILFVFARVVRRADEENEVSAMKREVRAADAAAASSAKPPAAAAEPVNKPLRS